VHAVVTDASELGARWVVAAAGAWSGAIAAAAGASPIERIPKRRTIVTFAAPDGIDVSGWSLVSNESQHIYFGPESGGLLVSPMDDADAAVRSPPSLRVHGGKAFG
jgi:D-arginine dehydrogenase